MSKPRSTCPTRSPPPGRSCVVRVEPTESYAPNTDEYWNNRPTVAWVQRTTLGVDAIADNDELLIWTTDLTTGAPVGDVAVELVGDGRTVTTDADGLARVELGGSSVVGLSASAGDRQALLPARGTRRGHGLDTGRRGALVRVRRPRHLPARARPCASPAGCAGCRGLTTLTCS